MHRCNHKQLSQRQERGQQTSDRIRELKALSSGQGNREVWRTGFQVWKPGQETGAGKQTQVSKAILCLLRESAHRAVVCKVASTMSSAQHLPFISLIC